MAGKRMKLDFLLAGPKTAYFVFGYLSHRRAVFGLVGHKPVCRLFGN